MLRNMICFNVRTLGQCQGFYRVAQWWLLSSAAFLGRLRRVVCQHGALEQAGGMSAPVYSDLAQLGTVNGGGGC